MNFDFALIMTSIPQLLDGIGLTFQLWFLSAILGLLLAIALMLMRNSGKWFLYVPAMVYIYIFRGTPILVQIFIIYYGLPQVEFIRESFMWNILREPFGCGILALTLNTGAYVSEILRGGVLGVPKGLGEAAAALGISKVQRFIYITAPLAIRLSLPAYSNDVISLMKSTALVSTITLLDMMGIARIIVSETYAPYEFFISLMIIYLILTWITQKIFALLERRINRHTIQ